MTELTSSVSIDSRASVRRRPGGPVGGSAVLTRLTIDAPAPSKEVASGAAVADLFAAVLATNPGYLPGVASGGVAFESWYRRKDPQWVRVARTPVMEPGVAGHIGVRLNGLLPDGRLLEDAGAPRLSWEVGMLVVRPGVRGCGIATALVHEATTTFARSPVGIRPRQRGRAPDAGLTGLGRIGRVQLARGPHTGRGHDQPTHRRGGNRMNVTCVLATAEQFPLGVEIAAAAQRVTGLPSDVDEATLRVALTQRQRDAAGVWLAWPVAATDTAGPVGHALAAVVGDDHHTWGCVTDPEVVAARAQGRLLELGGLSVHPDHHRQGIARSLQRARLAFAREHGYLPVAAAWNSSPGSTRLCTQAGVPVAAHREHPITLFRLRVTNL